jgi:hypothetical protein
MGNSLQDVMFVWLLVLTIIVVTWHKHDKGDPDAHA